MSMSGTLHICQKRIQIIGDYCDTVFGLSRMYYLVEVDYLVFHKYEEDVSGNPDDQRDVDEGTEDDHEDGVDQEARQMTISDIDS